MFLNNNIHSSPKADSKKLFNYAAYGSLNHRSHGITNPSTLGTCPTGFFSLSSLSFKAGQCSDSDFRGTKKKTRTDVKNQPHPSGFNLEHKKQEEMDPSGDKHLRAKT